MKLAFDMMERGYVPDGLIRSGIRRLLRKRLEEHGAKSVEEQSEEQRAFRQERSESPIAVHTGDANDQHYELPPRFFELCLGPRVKYSSAYYPTGRETLGEAEEAMLKSYGERAELADGQRIAQRRKRIARRWKEETYQ